MEDKMTLHPTIKIIRTYSAGVFMGEIDESTRSADGKRAVLLNSRMLWRWEGASALSELAMHGVSKPNDCKFPCLVDRREVTEIVEVLHCTHKAIESVNSVPEWKQRDE